MGFFGVQCVISLCVAFLLQKFSSLGTWLLADKLRWYLPPSDKELRKFETVPFKTKKYRRRRQQREAIEDNKEFQFRKKDCPDLLSVLLTRFYINKLNFNKELQIALDLVVGSLVIFLTNQFYSWIFPMRASNELNWPAIWLSVGFSFSTWILFFLTSIFFRNHETSAERSICLCSGFLYFFLSIAAIVGDGQVFNFGLKYLLPKSELSILGISFFGAIFGALLTFPGLKMARLHHMALRITASKPWVEFLLNVNFVSPAIMTLLWITSVDEYVSEPLRLWIIAAATVLRVVLTRKYLQAYLDEAPEKIMKLRQEAGKISNHEVQRIVSRVGPYLGSVALQYLCPQLVVFTSGLLYLSTSEWPFVSSILNFSTWWLCVLNFSSSCLGYAYYYYLDH